MDACPAEESLAELVEGHLPADQAASLHKHVRGCSRCRAALAGLADALSQDTEESATGDASALSWSGPRSVRFEPGAQIGRFRIEGLIGLGGMGTVYAARDPELGRTVAVKLLRVGGRTAADIEERRARLLREAQAMARLSHPHVVTVFEVGEASGHLFVVMEKVDGGTLTEWLRVKPRPLDQILDAFLDAGRGLAAAHAAGIVHRDFKPDNVLVGGSAGEGQLGTGRVRVTDFGLARPADPAGAVNLYTPIESPVVTPVDTLTATGAMVGTPAYMAPEQMSGLAIDARADLFSFCTALFEAVVGERPFAGKTLLALRQRMESGRMSTPSRWRGLPAWLRRELVRGLSVDPLKRQSSMDELLAALEAGRASSLRRRLLLRASLAAALLLVLAGAALRFSPLVWRRSAPGRRSVAVVGPRNLSGRPEAAWLSAALAEMLDTEVGADGTVRLLPARNVALALGDLGFTEGTAFSRESVQRLHASLGSELIVTGSFVESGERPRRLRLDLRLWEGDTGETLATVAEAGDEGRLFELVARAGSQLRQALGGDALAPARAAQASFPGEPETARLYTLGTSQLRGFESAEARDNLKAAAELLPDNPRIQGALAEAQSALGYTTLAKDAAKRAFESSAGLAREERLRIELAYRQAYQEWPRAIEIARALFTLFPDDVDSGLRLAQTQRLATLYRDSLATLQALRKLPPPAPDDPRIDLAEALSQSALGDYGRASQAAMHGAELARARGARWALAQLLYAAGNAERLRGDHPAAGPLLAEAQQRFTAVGDRVGAAGAQSLSATLLADSGDLPGARRELEVAIATFEELGNLRSASAIAGNLAILLRRMRDLPAAAEQVKKALAGHLSVGDRALEANTLAVLAHLHQDRGELGQSVQRYEESIAIRRQIASPLLPASLSGLAEVRLLRGELDAARALYVEAGKVARPQDRAQQAESMVGLGRLSLAEGKPLAAVEPLRKGAALYRESARRDESALAEVELASALASLGQKAEAREAVRRAQALLAGNSSQVARPAVEITAGLLQPAASPAERGAVRGTLQAALDAARRTGVVEDELRARLGLADLEPPSTAPSGDLARRALAREARARGFELYARRAEQSRPTTQ